MISLDSQTRTYLERKFKVVADTDFIGKRIQGLLRADRALAESRGACNHEMALYVGEQTACMSCGRVEHISWELGGIARVQRLAQPMPTHSRKEETE